TGERGADGPRRFLLSVGRGTRPVGGRRKAGARLARRYGGRMGGGTRADGWPLAFTDREGVGHWCRPGKDARQGPSATVNHAGIDRLYVFSTSVDWLES